MADTAIDSRIVEILNRLESIETTMNQYKGSKEKEGAIDNYKKDNKHRLRADLSDLKSRLAALNDSDDSDSVDDADDADVADNASDSSSVCGIPEDIVQRLNRVNWTQFKNHVVGDDSYIIDVLIGPVKSHWHIRQEKANLPQTGVDETKLGTGPIVGKPADQGAPTVEKERTESQPELPERIRINGSNLSQTLLDVAGMVNRDRDYFHFIRPYKLLIRHEKALRGRFLKLLALREKSLREVVQEQPSTESNQFDVANGEIGFDVDITSTQNTELIVYPDVEIDEREFHGLECLLGFMDTYLMPVYERYRSATAKKIRFSDLWYLYRPGDLVVMRNESKKKGLHHTTTSQVQPNLCRVLSVSRGRANLDTLHGSEDATRPPVVKIHNFRIQGYTIAYDGTSLGPVRQVFEIAPFQGEKDINALDPCPLRYVEGSESLESALVERGEKFLQYMEPSHCRYTGPTYSEHQIGFPCSIAEKHTTIDGYVIVDFKEARQEDDEWVLDHGIIPADTGAVSEVKEYHSRSIWHDKEHTKLKTTWFDDIYDDDHVDVDGQEEFVMSNAFLTAWRHSRGKPVSREKLERIDHALLPNRVVGYDLYRHKFSILALDYLQPVRANTDGWADLKLPRGHKSIVQAQIRTHFLRKMTRQSHGSESTDIDLVRGKGLGLVILLHGAPGVGKTSTVECVAESLGKPLYPITCGDLGTTPEHVEETLARTFAKTEAWDCVLLLDEADVFLAQRTRTDLNRNAIVSVFLRVLEYYKGTLILTTNRVGAFDEAFKSRIHLKLYYPALDKVQTLAIWKMNLERIITRKKGRLAADIPEILSFANQLFEQQNKNNAEWNGRQIRNAFQTALAMAEYEALGDSGLTADWELLEKINSRLEVRHLKVVADASAQFDDYIEETIGGNDAARARHDRERADHIKWYVNPQSESGPPQWTFNTTGPQTSGSFASPPGFKQSGMAFNAQKEPRSGQWPSNSPGPPEGSYQPANADPFASSSAYQQNMFFASQKAASAKTTFQQGASWTSPQQPWAGMGPSPARPSQESEGPNPYMLNATAPAGWSHMKDEREYGHQNPSFNQFDGGRQGAPSTPSNRDQRPNLHTPVGMGAAQSQDDDGY